ncbi:MAG: ribosome silencing factor [Candidatus Omnitrophica bacterium]|nr:ribosome silencing factor [Candidatus Omnitrophota bacterium]MBU1933343.1 ribosome silencing factor [Candidatus Omnitrophota bacterium]
MRSRQKALLVVELAKAKKAEDIVILDMRKLSNITDFFIIATSSSTARSQTIIDNIKESLLNTGESIASIEGYREGGWMLVDAYDVVLHVFSEEARLFYNLESLWADAPRVRLCQKKRKKTTKRSKKTSKRK